MRVAKTLCYSAHFPSLGLYKSTETTWLLPLRESVVNNTVSARRPRTRVSLDDVVPNQRHWNLDQDSRKFYQLRRKN